MKANPSSPLPFFLRRSPRAMVILLAAALVGCGTGGYDERLQGTLVGYQRIAKFNEFAEPVLLAGGNVSIRPPKKFKKPYRYGEPGVETIQNISPPFLQLPGATLGYVDTVANQATDQVDFHCYVAVVETQPEVAGVKKLVEVIQEELVKAFPASNPPPAWQQVPVQCETEDGATREWYTITAKGEQLFHQSRNGIHEHVKIPGTFELWLHQTADYTVLMAWRVPDSIEGGINLRTIQVAGGPAAQPPPLMWRDAAKLMGGTLKVTAPAPFPTEALAAPGDEGRLGVYKLRLPAGLKTVAAPAGFRLPGGVQTAAWKGDIGLLVGVQITPPPGPILSLDHVMGATAQLIVAAAGPNFKITTMESPQPGTISGLRFVRSKVGLTDGATPRTGVIYIGMDGPARLIFFSEAADDNNLKAMQASILSLTKS